MCWLKDLKGTSGRQFISSETWAQGLSALYALVWSDCVYSRIMNIKNAFSDYSDIWFFQCSWTGPFCVCIHAYELCSHYQYISHDITCIQVCLYSFSCLSWECQSECRQGWVSPWASAGGLAAGNAMAVPGRPPVIAPRDEEKIEVSILIVLQFSIHSLFNWQWLYTFHSLFSHSFLRFQHIDAYINIRN